ncbi:calcium/sodium antiporter [Kordiimonas pumila]|uniref:Calcium/sodium antiporter n=1 Tax=Kordiimonas pumila TaxID=2161677 RepID=A0ABV7D753_9PROT|nr:calcium/sodium antiporter [Kordiimonas pumila]
MAYFEVAAGLILLLFSGDYLVRGAASLATRAGISKLIIGLTVVAFGTSAPEMVVGIDAVMSGAPTLALGNIVGSNIANILLVVGLPALLAPMTCDAPRLGRNLFIMLLATALFIALAFTGSIGRPQGFVLLVCFALFLIYSAMRAKVGGAAEITNCDEIPEKPDSYALATVLVLGGLVGISFGADLLVEGSVVIAREYGIKESVIGLTLVAIGTSLPELATALMAAIRRQCDVAVGNVIGSNIFNILAIMGISSMAGTIPVPQSFLNVDLWVMLGSALLLVPFCKNRSTVGKLSGLGMLVLYGIYMFYLVESGNATATIPFTS